MENPGKNSQETPISARTPMTLRAHVVQMLNAAILSGKYRPGDRLNESQIARELNISRIPVREVLSQLQEQGLVQNRERRGMFVINIGRSAVTCSITPRYVIDCQPTIISIHQLH